MLAATSRPLSNLCRSTRAAASGYMTSPLRSVSPNEPFQARLEFVIEHRRQCRVEQRGFIPAGKIDDNNPPGAVPQKTAA